MVAEGRTTSAWETQNIKNNLKNIVRVLLILILSIIGLEVILQTFHPVTIPSIIKQASPPWVKLDDYCFWHNQPLGAFTWINWQGLPNIVYTDQRGFRTSAKFQEEDGLLCLGDSSTFGLGINYEESYPSLLGAANGGVVGFTTINILYYLQAYKLPAETHIVTIMTGWNDASLEQYIESPAHGKTLWMRRMILKSAIIRNWRTFSLKVMKRYLSHRQESAGRLVAEDKYIETLIKILTEIRAQDSMPYYIEMPIPSKKYMAVIKNPILKHSGLTQRATAIHYQSMARQICTTLNVPYIETQEVFNDWAEDDVYLDQIHPTAIGHQVIANQIAMRLKTDKLW